MKNVSKPDSEVIRKNYNKGSVQNYPGGLGDEKDCSVR